MKRPPIDICDMMPKEYSARNIQREEPKEKRRKVSSQPQLQGLGRRQEVRPKARRSKGTTETAVGIKQEKCKTEKNDETYS